VAAEAEKAKAGQPTLYRDEYVKLAYRYCLLGATDADLARNFEVDERTVNNWKEKHPEFFQSLKAGKEEADAKVAQSLYHRAKGYRCKEDKVFLHEGQPVIVPGVKEYPPDATSAIFWLKNRKSAFWRDKQEIDFGDSAFIITLPKSLEGTD